MPCPLGQTAVAALPRSALATLSPSFSTADDDGCNLPKRVNTFNHADRQVLQVLEPSCLFEVTLYCSALIYNILTFGLTLRKAIFTPCVFQALEKASL